MIKMTSISVAASLCLALSACGSSNDGNDDNDSGSAPESITTSSWSFLSKRTGTLLTSGDTFVYCEDGPAVSTIVNGKEQGDPVRNAIAFNSDGTVAYDVNITDLFGLDESETAARVTCLPLNDTVYLLEEGDASQATNVRRATAGVVDATFGNAGVMTIDPTGILQTFTVAASFADGFVLGSRNTYFYDQAGALKADFADAGILDEGAPLVVVDSELIVGAANAPRGYDATGTRTERTFSDPDNAVGFGNSSALAASATHISSLILTSDGYQLARWNLADGALDTTFGTNGVINLELAEGTRLRGNGYVASSDQWRFLTAADSSYAILTVNADGTSTTTALDLSGVSDLASATFLSDGRLAVAGSREGSSQWTSEWAARIFD